jgi:hypothetical protein
MLQKFLKENRDAILKKWVDQTINTYKPEMVRFLKKEKNNFSNPVRYIILSSLEKIIDSMLNGIGVEEYHGLEDMIKLRAVQEFSPSEALSFLFNLKKIIRQGLLDSKQTDQIISEACIMDEKFDTLYALAFDIYNDCRTKIQEIKINEIKSRSERAIENLNKKKI